MPEDQIIALLTEIRDLQKQNVENYKTALLKQQEAIELQKKHVAEFQARYLAWRRYVILLVFAVLAAVVLLFGLTAHSIR